MRVDVLLAVGLGVAVKQVLDAVGKTAQPGAVDHVIDFFAVDDEYAQQLGQVWRSPVPGDKTLGKTNVA